MKSFKPRVGILLLGGILAFFSFAPALLFSTDNKVQAQAGGYSAEWIDRTHIRVTEGPPLNRTSIYTDSNLDSNYNFKNLNQGDPCQSEIWINGTPPTSSAEIIVVVTDAVDRNCQLRYDSRGSHDPGDVVLCEGPDGRPLWDRRGYTGGSGNCDDSIRAHSINISGAAAGSINFRFVNDDTIEKVDGSQTLVRESGDIFVEEEGECGDSIILDGGTQTLNGQTVHTGTYRERSSGGDGGGCAVDSSQRAYVTEAEAPGGGGGGGSGPGAPPEDSCESAGAMGWIMCPVVTAIEGALDWVDTQIQALLSIDANYYNNADMREAFNIIRNVAYIILVPIVLVMVISTALGFDFISAYTVKRALPRLIVAVIFIALSYQICVFLIEMFNALGGATLGIITSPFASGTEELSLRSLFDDGSILTGLLQSVIAIPGLIIALWLFGGTLLLFAATAFLVLLLRQIFIVVLLLAAPLAILAWIFPGNDKLWKLWWGSFSKLLIMYPLIMAVIAVGRIFAFTMDSSNPAGLEGAVLKPVMTIVAYMIPYAFIPFTFKFAGGLFASVSGMVNDRSKGLFDRQRKKRQERLQNWKTQNAFKGGTESNFRGKLNTALAAGMNAGALGYNPARWRGRMNKTLRDNSIQGREAMLKDEEFTWRNNDTLAAMAALSSNESELRQMARENGYDLTEDQVADVEHMRRKYGNSAFRQAAWMRAAAGGTVFDRPGTGPLGDMSVWHAAALASGGNRSVLADLVGSGRGEMKGAGRYDEGGGGWSATYGVASKFLDPSLNYSDDQARQEMTAHIYDQNGGAVFAHSSLKDYAVEQMTPRMVESVNAGIQSKDHAEFAGNLAGIAAVYDGMSASNPAKAKILRERVMSEQINVGDLTPEMRQALDSAISVRDEQGNVVASNNVITYAQAIEAARSNPTWQEFRREYSASTNAWQQAQLQQAQQQQRPGAGAAPPPTGQPGAGNF